MKAVVLAYSNIGCVGIEALLNNGIEIAAIFTHRDDPKENIWFSSVANLAALKNIPVFAPEDINHPIWIEKIKKINPDIIFSFYYRNMVKQPILDIPKLGCINLHGSLLPKYRGKCPINWVLINGEKETGVTLHYMVEKPDAGDIIIQKKIEIKEDDTAKTLHEKSVHAAKNMLDEILPKIKNKTAPKIKQDDSKSSYYTGRKPENGLIDWNKSAEEIYNLVRAVTSPFPGAFSFVKNKKIIFWNVSKIIENKTPSKPGAIISIDPLVISCGKGAIEVNSAQIEDGISVNGSQAAKELNLSQGQIFGQNEQKKIKRKKSVLILGVNGFIGNALGERLLKEENYEVYGIDLRDNQIQGLLKNPNFHFKEGDVSINQEWIEYHIKKCDVILPLVAIATPIEYMRNPLKVFELDFEENLKVVRYCVKYNKRIIFPSTSEVYGMCQEEEFDEDNSHLVLGPIRMQRWIYSCSKQLLDRVIWAYGQKQGLEFTLFRPFNWIGPKLDSLNSARIGSSRVITQLILNLVEGTPILLIEGGRQKRCFTDVADGVECLYQIIEDKNNTCNGQIINIGNPHNDASIKELAELLVEKFEHHPLRKKFPPFAGIREVESQSYYGEGYQDVQFRKPSIKNAKKFLNWTPQIGLKQAVEGTLDFFLKEEVKNL